MRLPLVLILTFVSACASTGHKFDAGAVSKLQPGVTTEAQAVEILKGPPTMRQAAAGSGNYLLTWTFIHAEFFFSNANVKGNTLTLKFNKDGVLQSVVSQIGMQ